MKAENNFLETLDCFDVELRPFVPYLLQDLWEIGSNSQKILDLIKGNRLHLNKLKILDLGCGKGGITIPIAKELNAEVLGIDAMPEFIEEAKNKAAEFAVDKLCTFECGDVVKLISGKIEFDIVLLASVGPIFGDVAQTLSVLEKSIKSNGHIIIDDCYLPDNSVSEYSRCQRESEFYDQIYKSNFIIADKLILSPQDTADVDNYIYGKIENRAKELSEKNPTQKKIFDNYLAAQRKENYSLENDLCCATILLKRKY